MDFLVVGAGITGLAFAEAVQRFSSTSKHSLRVIERASTIGGYCRTVVRDGFVWDYAGHFFHFRRPDIDAWFKARLPPGSVHHVVRRARVVARVLDREVEVPAPFQHGLHALPPDLQQRCLADWRAAVADVPAKEPRDFLSMIEARYGKAIVEMFLRPYNEKLYSVPLDRLAASAMGRFFPAQRPPPTEVDAPAGADAKDGGYNATFSYCEHGAIAYVNALRAALPSDVVVVDSALVRIDLDEHIAHTPHGATRYRHLICTAPLPEILRTAQLPHDSAAFSANQVLVFNFGFDELNNDAENARVQAHWIYFSDPNVSFYRVGIYSNILPHVAHHQGRLSLYVECAAPSDHVFDVDAMRERVLSDLQRMGIVGHARLRAAHHVVLKPAYVHVTDRSERERQRVLGALALHDVHCLGRYGAFTYNAIEDNIVDAQELAQRLLTRISPT